jgi:hypothetical protein
MLANPGRAARWGQTLRRRRPRMLARWGQTLRRRRPRMLANPSRTRRAGDRPRAGDVREC